MPATPDPQPIMAARAGVLAGLAVLTLLAALGVLLAPVVAEDPVVSWPQAGQLARSTVLPLVPYRPLRLTARVPCRTLAMLSLLDSRGDGGEALRTLPATAGTPRTAGQGLLVAVRHGVVQISASGAVLVRAALPAGGCTYQIRADAGGVRVLRDGVVLHRAALRVPEVSELATDADGQEAAAGLAVSLHTDARYESTPTTLKIGLLVVCAVALLALLTLSWRWWGGQRQEGPLPRPLIREGPRMADAVLVVVCAVWVLLAPTNFDDPWYLLMARGAQRSGSISNAIYMFNVTENPFVTSQYVLQAWGALGGWGLAWMRLVPLVYGLGTWLLLRVLLVAGFSRQLGSGRATWALLVAYLLWWLPYGMTLRPEPLIVLLAAATLLLAQLARCRRSVGALTAATATAALALSVSPSGLVAAAPLVLALPWLWRWWRSQGALTRVATVLVLAGATTSLVLVGFADATLGDVLESTAVHRWYYQTFAWYQETVHYQAILSFKDSSQWARRAPVVLTIALLLVVAVGPVMGAVMGAARSPRNNPADDDPVRRLLVSSAACSAIALVLLTPTPTKFVNHFGAAAAAPTLLLIAALLRPVSGDATSRSHRHSRLIATAILVGAMSLSFAGPNLWRPYSDRGQPFGDHLTAAQDHPDLGSMRPELGGVQLANPALWVGLALAASCGGWWWRRRGRDTGLTADRAVLLVGSSTLVVMTIVVFVWAPLRQYPGWSVALSATRAGQGQPCALAHYAQVLVDTAAQPVPAGPAIMGGAFAGPPGRSAPVPAPVAGTRVWYEAIQGEGQAYPDAGALTKTGWLVTPWFALPTQGGTALLVPLLGAHAGQRLALEYATAAGRGPAVTGRVALPVDPTVPPTQWQQVALALEKLGTRRPASVRLVIRDPGSDAESVLAVGQPRLARWRPLAAFTARTPVYVDQLAATLLPCVEQVGVEHGIARAPEVLVRTDEGFTRPFVDLGFELQRGGTLVPVSRCATTVRVPTRLVPSGPPTLPWARVERVVYDHPVGLVDLRVGVLRRAGWTRLPTLADKSYHGDATG